MPYTQFVGHIERGATNLILHALFEDSAGAAITGMTYLTPGLACAFIRSGETAQTAITFEDIATLGTYVSPTLSTRIRLKEVDAVNLPGVYELQIHNAWVNTTNSTRHLHILITGNGIKNGFLRIELTGVNLNDPTRGGMTNIASGSPGAVNGAPICDAAGRVSVNLTAINNTSLTSGLANLTLKSLTINNSSGTAITITGGGGPGIQVTGSTSGVSVTGGNSDALRLIGGSGSSGLFSQGTGGGDGAHFQAGATGRGLHARGGAASGEAVYLEAVGGGAGISVIAVGNYPGVQIDGSGTGAGLKITAGATGTGLHVLGGSTSGAGATIQGQAGDSGGLTCVGFGNSSGIVAVGAGTGYGLYATGANGIVGSSTAVAGIGIWGQATGSGGYGIRGQSTSGPGLQADSSGGNSAGVVISGNGSGAGIDITAGATGIGLLAKGGATSGAGSEFRAQAGNSNGLTCTKSGSGSDIAAATITGNLAGAVTNVTNVVSANVTQVNGSATAASRMASLWGAVKSGTVAGVPTTTNIPTSLTDATNFWNNAAIIFTSGALNGLTAKVSSYSNTGGTITPSVALPSAPSAGDTFEIIGRIE